MHLLVLFLFCFSSCFVFLVNFKAVGGGSTYIDFFKLLIGDLAIFLRLLNVVLK